MNTASPNVDITGMLLAMLVIICLIFVFAWLLKRISGSVGFNNKLIKVQSVSSLGVKEKLVVVEVNGQYLLLGVTPHQISLLKELDEAPTIDAVPESSPFSDKLKSLLRGSDQWQDPGNPSKK